MKEKSASGAQDACAVLLFCAGGEISVRYQSCPWRRFVFGGAGERLGRDMRKDIIFSWPPAMQRLCFSQQAGRISVCFLT